MGMREEFEERYPVPSGMRWEPKLGIEGEYILADSRFCEVSRAARHMDRWEGWQESRKVMAVKMPDSGDAKYWVEYAEVEGQCFEWPLYNADVRAAIKATGAKVIE